MNKRVGMWFDNTKTIIISITDNGEEIKRFASNMEHYVRFSSSIPGDGSPEDARDRRFWNHLGEYYDKVIGYICDAKAIQIFGPGDAKDELKKRLEGAGLAEYIVTVDNADKLTDLQITKRVRERFPAKSQFDIS